MLPTFKAIGTLLSDITTLLSGPVVEKGVAAKVSNPNSMVYLALAGMLLVPTKGAAAKAM